MWCGYFTEMVSRPNENFDDWQCDRELGKRWNYARRMFPHVMGFFPYAAAWFIILNNFDEQVKDLCLNLEERMPDFVNAIVYGSFGVFSIFTVVQWR